MYLHPHRKNSLLWVVVWLLASLGVVSPSLAATHLRVGVYANPPLQSFSEDGIPEGLVIDILETIAHQEGWQLTYVPCIWDECLAMLEAGEIDLLGAIAYTAERTQRFTFNQETLLNNWGQVYTRNDDQLESVLDLEGKRIAILRNDIHASALQNLLASFNIAAQWVETDSYATVFAMTASGDVDAGVVNHFFEMQNADVYGLHPTPIIFNPIEIRFAATKDAQLAILETVDEYLAAAKANNNSFYHTAIDTWFGAPITRFEMPDWARWLAFGISGAALLFLLVSVGLRNQVHAQTRELRASQERLDLAIRGTDVGLWDWNIESGETIVNEKWASMIGYSLDELNPVNMETWNRMTHPDDLAESQRRLETHFSGENEQYDCEIRLRHKDGHWIWVLDRGRVFKRTHDGHPLRMAGTQLEITQRKQAEADLAYNRQLFQALLEQSLDGIGVTNLEGQYILVNPAFCALTGYSDTELLTMQVSDLLPSNDEMVLFPKVQQGESGVRTLRLQRKDGSTFFAEVSGAAITIEGQRLVLGTVRNIDTRIEWEDALRESEEHFRGLSEATFEAIFISEDGICLEQNLAAEQLFGYKVEEALGKKIIDWVSPEDRELVIHNVRTGNQTPYRITALRKNGSTFTCEVRARMMEYRGRNVRVSALRDISQQATAEQTLHRRAEELDALYNTTLDIIAPHELPRLLKTIVRRAIDLLRGTSGGMYLAEEDYQRMRCVVSCNTPKDYTGVTLAYGEGAAGTVAETGEALIIDDYRIWDKRANIYEGEQPFSAIISVPMRWQERIIGVLHVLHDTETRTFNQDDLNLLSAFANQAAIAVENARLLDELHKHAEKLEERVRDRTAELQIMVNAMSGREVRMAGLKKAIQKLREQLIQADIKPAANDPLLEQYSGDSSI